MEFLSYLGRTCDEHWHFAPVAFQNTCGVAIEPGSFSTRLRRAWLRLCPNSPLDRGLRRGHATVVTVYTVYMINYVEMCLNMYKHVQICSNSSELEDFTHFFSSAKMQCSAGLDHHQLCLSHVTVLRLDSFSAGKLSLIRRDETESGERVPGLKLLP